MKALLLLLALGLGACGSSQPSSALTKVYKGDGSVQCGDDGTSIEEGAAELRSAGIDVICGQKGNDGMGHCAACGCETGQLNVYTIHSQNLPDAEALGYGPVSELPGYVDTPCG